LSEILNIDQRNAHFAYRLNETRGRID